MIFFIMKKIKVLLTLLIVCLSGLGAQAAPTPKVLDELSPIGANGINLTSLATDHTVLQVAALASVGGTILIDLGVFLHYSHDAAFGPLGPMVGIVGLASSVSGWAISTIEYGLIMNQYNRIFPEDRQNMIGYLALSLCLPALEAITYFAIWLNSPPDYYVPAPDGTSTLITSNSRPLYTAAMIGFSALEIGTSIIAMIHAEYMVNKLRSHGQRHTSKAAVNQAQQSMALSPELSPNYLGVRLSLP
jgi:hypothetical protein